MESKAVFWVNSLAVPCVQELAKEPLTTIPPRYIRPDQQQQPIVSDAGLVWEIPVIDMQSLLSEESTEAELTKLDFACREWGFFRVCLYIYTILGRENERYVSFWRSHRYKE